LAPVPRCGSTCRRATTSGLARKRPPRVRANVRVERSSLRASNGSQDLKPFDYPESAGRRTRADSTPAPVGDNRSNLLDGRRCVQLHQSTLPQGRRDLASIRLLIVLQVEKDLAHGRRRLANGKSGEMRPRISVAEPDALRISTARESLPSTLHVACDRHPRRRPAT